MLEFARDHAERHHSPVHALHAASNAPPQHGDGPVPTDVVQEAPADALITRSAHARLLVVGNHHHGAVHRAVRGSVSRAALHHARCPVAIVPARGRELSFGPAACPGPLKKTAP